MVTPATLEHIRTLKYPSPRVALVSEQPGTRGERKERTRRAILDAALVLSRDGTLAAVSLRQVAKEVGVVPTAFYRHFASVDELGLSLVEESFEHLRHLIRDVRRVESDVPGIIDGSLPILAQHVRERREHFAFLVRERRGGTGVVRSAVRHELDLFERELATDLARLPGVGSAFPDDDLAVLANLVVNTVVAAVEDLVDATTPKAEDAVLARLRAQLRMIGPQRT